MVRFSSSTNYRARDRARSRARARKRARWSRMPISRKALITAKKALRRTSPPEYQTFWMRRPNGPIDYGTGVNIPAAGSTSQALHGYYWGIGYHHPYGAEELYWVTATNRTVGHSLLYQTYSFPPKINGATDGYTTDEYSNPTLGTSAQRLHTRVPAVLYDMPSTGTGATNYTGNAMYLDNMRVTGDIVFAFSPLAADGTRDHLVINPHSVILADTTVTMKPWLMIIAVQQFKDNVKERDITPADVFGLPFQTYLQTAATDDGVDTMEWHNPSYTKNVKDGRDEFAIYDDNRVVGVGAAAAAPDAGTIAARGLNFKVIDRSIIQFSATDLDTRRLRRVTVNKTYKPVQRKVWFGDTSVSEGNLAPQRMNPMFVWILSSHAFTSAAPGAETHAVKAFAGLYERLNISSRWHADP